MRRTPHRLLRPMAWILPAALVAAGGVRADEGTRMRVRLVAPSEVVQVAGRSIRAGTAGLYAGSRRLGTRWRVPGEGPHEVEGLRVRGSVEVRHTPEGAEVINRVALEDYVAGTLGREIYPRWHDETLKAQAVVTRTYALYQREQRRGEAFDVGAGTAHQVYGGAGAETERIRAAVAATRAEILEYGGRPILAAFHSASGGRTASAEEVWGRSIPYLVSRPVPNEEDSPDTYWRARVTGTTLGRALAPLGLRLGAVLQARVVDRSPSGRALRVLLTGAEGGGAVTGRELRTALGPGVLRSTLFEIRSADEIFIFAGSGHGHGVGMSQWGAEAMAKRGATYRAILEAFYPGVVLTRGAR